MFNLTNKSCPYDNWVATARKSCDDPDRYHCLNDEFSRPGWICADPIWVEAGRCPEYNSMARKMDSVICNGSYCPISPYQSQLSHLYEDCRTAVIKTTEPAFPSLHPSTPSSDKESPPISIGVVLGSLVGILALLLITFFLIRYYRRKRKSKSESRDPQERMAMLDISESDNKTALGRSCRALRTERFVVIIGIQGAGKTFLAERLYEKCKDCEKVWIRQLNQFPEEEVEQNGRISYFLDDLFYELQSEEKVKRVKMEIDTLYERTVVKRNGQIILTITSLIWKRHASLFHERNYHNLIDLDQLCSEDREDILNFHMNLNNIVLGSKKSDDPPCSVVMKHKDYDRFSKESNQDFDSHVKRGIGIASSIALFCQYENRNFVPEHFSRTSLAWLHNYWTDVINVNWTGTTVILALMAIQNEELDVNRIDQMCLTKIKEMENIQNVESFPSEELEELEKKRLIEKTADDRYRFQVSTDKKVLLRVILQKHPELEEFCDQEMLRRRVYRPESLPVDIKGDYVKTFVLKR
uniref:Uncharacterized protein LOC111109593 n=1 Tax=Crassostrea virginica TaxID=6565 RepID=A0A8B8BDL6_CRAVI|nr:uncharacterized protein LOC111109593 [Crassostrea virginica]